MSNKKPTTIFSWNVNGMRALAKKEALQSMLDYKADIYCLQETKVTEPELPENARPVGYYIYVHASSGRKGHAGTMLYSKQEPQQVLFGFPKPWQEYDQQGRTITAVYENFTLINCYFPNGGSDTSNLEYKLKFYDIFLQYINMLRAQGQNVIIAGDWNIAHTEIDIARPKENADSIGFLPVERAWLDRFHSEAWIDIWRSYNPDARDAYTWWSFRSGARERNIGWRIDYIFTDKSFLDKKTISKIQQLETFTGSDHCPVVMEVLA